MHSQCCFPYTIIGMENNGMECYQITIDSKLDETWMDWFSCRTIKQKGKMTVLTIQVQDQSALYGALMKIHNLGLPLISLMRTHPPCSHQGGADETEYPG